MREGESSCHCRQSNLCAHQFNSSPSVKCSIEDGDKSAVHELTLTSDLYSSAFFRDMTVRFFRVQPPPCTGTSTKIARDVSQSKDSSCETVFLGKSINSLVNRAALVSAVLLWLIECSSRFYPASSGAAPSAPPVCIGFDSESGPSGSIELMQARAAYAISFTCNFLSLQSAY